MGQQHRGDRLVPADEVVLGEAVARCATSAGPSGRGETHHAVSSGPLLATDLAFQTSDGTLAIPLSYTSETRQRGLGLPVPRVAFPHQSSFDALVTVPAGALRPDRTIRLPADVPPSRDRLVLAANRNDWLVGRGGRLDAYSRVEFAPTQAQALAPPALSPRPIARLEVRPPLEPTWKLRCEKAEYPCTFFGFALQPDGSRVFAGSYFKASRRLAGSGALAIAVQHGALRFVERVQP